MEREQYEYWTRTASFGLILIGIAGIIFVPVFWAITDRVVLAFLPFFATLAGVGQGLNVLKEISQARGGGGNAGPQAEANGTT
jgi:hypothetical protein